MEKNKNVPKLRFPEFTGEWEEKKLGEVAIFKSGYAFKSEFMLSKKCKYQILKMSNVYQNELNLERNPSYLESIDEKQKDFLLRKGDSILTLTGTVGKKDFGYSVIINEDNKFLLNQRLVLLREVASISANGFINYVLSTEKFLFFFFAEAKGGTGNQTNVSTEDVKNISLGFPHLPEQTKIASFLTSVDEKLTQLKKKKTLLEQYKKGIMQKLFSQELRFKDNNNQDFPDWQEKTLGEIGEFIGGGTPSTKNNEYWSGNIPWISSSDLTEGSIFKINSTRFISEEAISQSATKLVPVNSVLIVSRVGVGKVAVSNSPLCTSQDFTNLVPLNQNSIFLAYLIKLKTDSLLGFNQGTSIKGFVKSDLESLKLLIPSLPEQQKIATFLSAIDEKISHSSAQIEKMEAWKKGLLQQMFC